MVFPSSFLTRFCRTVLLLAGLAAAAAAQAQTCSIPGQAGTDTAVAAQPNSFFPGTNSPAAGATSLTVGAVTGVSRAIAVGDLLLIIQMQGADINSTNTNFYGNGTSGGAVTNTVAYGTTGYAGDITGANALAGNYEWAIAANTVATTGGTLNLNSPLVNSYGTRANTTTLGKRSFQVVRVPQYANATVSANLTVQAWDGSSGGILAMDVAGVLTLSNRTINGSGRGFRGGGAVEIGANAACTAAGVYDGTGCKEYVATIAASLGGSKGEGIVGTPARIYNDPTNSGAGAVTAGTVDGYPNGEAARGAPGNAGGGGNQHNAGGGGGGNGGAGGKGGNTWNGSTAGFAGLQLGGFGGAPSGSNASVWRMGGGGGAGDIGGNGTTTPAGSGGAAGAMVILRASRIVAATTVINVNGAAGLSSATTDAGGGGGSGGTVIIAAGAGGASAAITVTANGGAGGNYAGGNVEQDGPGGGGGGGVLIHNLATAPTFTANGGARGNSNTTAGCAGTGCGAVAGVATGGSAGYAIVSPGTQVGYECLPDLDVTKATSTPVITGSTGATAAYTITITNNGGGARFATLLDPTLPPGWLLSAAATYAYSSGGAGIASGAETAAATHTRTWVVGATPATVPAVGANALTWTSFAVAPVVGGVPGVVTVSFIATIPNTATVGSYHNGAGVRFFDPTRAATATSLVAPQANVTANRTVTSYGTNTYAAYNGVTTSPVGGSNYNGLVAGPTNEDVKLVPDFSITKVSSLASVTPGSTFSYTITPRNNGRAIGSYTFAVTQATDVTTANIGTQLASSPLTITDTLPSGVTLSTAFNGTGWTCGVSGTSTVVCTRADSAAYPIAAGTNYPTVTANATMTATCNPSAPAARINSVEISSPTDESVTSNNTATAVTNVTCVSANLSVNKTNAVTAVPAGSTTAYTVTVANLGAGAANGTVLTDVPSAGLSCTAVTCTASGGAVCPVVGGGAGQLSTANLFPPGGGVTLPTLPSGGNLFFRVFCSVTATGQP